ncbi:MAG: response regulator [Ignavibacteriales bacterium]|nr:response regulator [Ignavibacteriales bacterium]
MEKRYKVLVVDDEELAQDFLKYFLSKQFEVHTCGSVNAFYSIINSVDFDLILMDISLRDNKDGIDLTRELKMMEKYKDIPVFVLTAFNTTKERNSSFEAGAKEFLAKPVDGKALLQLINSVLTKPEPIFKYNS